MSETGLRRAVTTARYPLKRLSSKDGDRCRRATISGAKRFEREDNAG